MASPYIWRDQRDEEIRDEVRELVEALLRNYYETDPAKGQDSQIRKFEVAQQTIDIFWALYNRLAFWAQSQLVGKVIAYSNPELIARLSELWGLKEIDEDSHFMEYLGHSLGSSSLHLDDPVVQFLANHEELEEQLELSQPMLRRAVRELLSASGDHRNHSSFWREPLRDALQALNFGQAVEPLIPSSERRRSEFFETLEWKSMALCHVNFLVGQGLKKHVALDRVARVLNQSPETLRSWEKLLKGDDEFCEDARATRLAGELQEEIEKTEVSDLEERYGNEGFRNRSYVWMAKRQLLRIKNIPLELVRDRLNSIRRAKKTGT
jgi:hypothetical protein